MNGTLYKVLFCYDLNRKSNRESEFEFICLEDFQTLEVSPGGSHTFFIRGHSFSDFSLIKYASQENPLKLQTPRAANLFLPRQKYYLKQ